MMKTSGRKRITISILIPFLVFSILFSTLIWQKYRSSRILPEPPPSHGTVISRSITLFFVADGTRLVREARELDACDDAAGCLKNVLDELLSGPVGAFDTAVPEGTSVKTMHIDGSLATVDFNRAFAEAVAPGSSAEMMAVYSVVNTVTANFPQIQMVKINVDGETNIRLRHLDLSEPLSSDFSLEQLPMAPPEKHPGVTTKQ
jgi:spore germination protein GerM